MILYYEGCLSSGERDICSGLSSKIAAVGTDEAEHPTSTECKQLGYNWW